MALLPREGGTVLSEINVTPFVDVMLVLLIIFMVTAPLMLQGVEVNLPTAKAPPMKGDETKLVITVTKEREVFLNKTRFDLPGLKKKLAAIYAERPDREIFLRGDKDVPYGFVLKVMALAKEAGIQKVGMVTQPLELER